MQDAAPKSNVFKAKKRAGQKGATVAQSVLLPVIRLPFENGRNDYASNRDSIRKLLEFFDDNGQETGLQLFVERHPNSHARICIVRERHPIRDLVGGKFMGNKGSPHRVRNGLILIISSLEKNRVWLTFQKDLKAYNPA